MRTVSKVLLALCLLWNVGALAQQPTPFLPYPDLTPGGVFDDVTLQDICTPGYSKKVRAVTKALRDQAYKSYGITSYQPGEYQLDHLIPLSIGGSNSILNLWPQSNNTSPWNARTKDALEQRLRKLVCSGQVDLETAQREIATNWINAYQKYIGASPPVAVSPERLLAPSGTEDQVWVNTRSGKYWKPGSQFFGKTKQGKFMTEPEAIEKGYRPAGGTGH
jgi:hypothetical protein